MPGEVCQLCLSLIVRVWLWDPLPFWTISLNTFTLTYVGRPLFYLLSIPGRPRKSSEVGGGGPGPGLPTGTPDRFVLSFYLEKKKLNKPQSTWICNYMSGKHLKHTLSWHDPGTGEQGLEVLEESHSLSLAAGGSLRSLFTFFKSVIMVMLRNCILPPSQNDALLNQVRLPILHQVLPHLLQRPQRPQPGLSFHHGHG